MTLITRCFMPPRDSMGYLPSTAGSRLTKRMRSSTLAKKERSG